MPARLTVCAVLLASGCFSAGATVRARHAAEFHCQGADVTVEDVGAGTIRARGCGVEAMYVCVARGTGHEEGTCVRNSEAVPLRQTPVLRRRATARALGIQRGSANGRPALRAVLDDGREPIEIVANAPEALLLRAGGDCERASLLTSSQEPIDLERVRPGVFRVPLDAVAGRVDGSHSLILRLCAQTRPFSALERDTLRQIIELAPSLASSPAGGDTVPTASESLLALRAALDARREALLACVAQPSVAVWLRWDASGAVRVSLQGALAGSAQEECVRVAAGTLTHAATAPGELLHAVTR